MACKWGVGIAPGGIVADTVREKGGVGHDVEARRLDGFCEQKASFFFFVDARGTRTPWRTVTVGPAAY